MLGIIIQARMGSNRFPQKILKPFANSTILFFLVDRLKQLNIPIIVATTTSKQDDELCVYLKKNNISYYRGSENNVLERYIYASKEFKFSEIIRICSDSPLIDINMLEKLIAIWRRIKVDYLSFSYKGLPTVLCHYGVFAELTTLEALEKVQNNYDKEENREHVTYGIYTNKREFNISLIELPSYFDRYKNIRITVDTLHDYENLLYLYDNIANVGNCGFKEIAETILKNETLLNAMKNSIINNKK